MSDTTDIEKKSLEAHVELCAERYRSLDARLDTLTEKIGHVEKSTNEINEKLSEMAEKNNDRVLNWTLGTIIALVSMVGWLLTTYVLK